MQLWATVSGSDLLRTHWVRTEENRTTGIVLKGMTSRHMKSGWEQGGSNECGKCCLDLGAILKVNSTWWYSFRSPYESSSVYML